MTRGPALTPLVVSRVGLFAFAWIALVVSPLVLRHGQWAAFPDAPALDGWARWDSGWYWSIADHGYSAVGREQSNLAFFPLYPLIAWLVSLPLRIALSDARAFYLAGMLVSQVAFAAAAVGLAELGRDLVGEAAARRAVWLFCLFPFSLFFSGVYTEALFVAFAIWAFVAARRGHWWLASGLAALASVTRVPGFTVGVGVAVEYLAARRSRVRALDRGALALACMPLLVAIYMIYLWGRFGDPLVFVHFQKSGWGRSLGVRHFIVGWHTVLRARGMESYVTAWYLALAAGTVALVIPVWRRLGPGYGCFVALSTVMGAGTGIVAIGRFTSVLFPLFLIGGVALGRRSALVVCLVFAANLALFTYSFTHWGPVF